MPEHARKWPRGLRGIFLILGLGLFAWFLYRAGPVQILDHVTGLGWKALIVPCPYLLVYLLDTWGWRMAFGRYAGRVPSYRMLFRVRWASESINSIIPSAYLGGEVLKVYLLHKRGVSGLVAGTSVVASKTCQALGQVMFIGLGALAALPHLTPGSGVQMGMGAITLVAFLGVVCLFLLQRQGMFTGLQAVLARLSIRLKVLEKNRETLQRLDQQVFEFYRKDRVRFFQCNMVYLAGWLADAVEIYVVCHVLGLPLDWTEALAIESFISVAKAIGFFVPASLGVQESGVVLLFHIFALPATVGATYAILRRGRELIYVLIGGTLLYTEESSFKALAGLMRAKG